MSHFFREADNPALRYPVAENSEAFALAQLELFRLVIDGLSLEVLQSLSTKLNVTLPALKEGERRGTMNTLKAILPNEFQEAVYNPLRACSNERNKLHGIPNRPAHAFAAFKTFHRHAQAIYESIAKLREWLEYALAINAENCLKREQAMKFFPRFDGPLRPEFKHGAFKQAEGKTIDRIEAGEVNPSDGCHGREALVFHFTDGTALNRCGVQCWKLRRRIQGFKGFDVFSRLSSYLGT